MDQQQKLTMINEMIEDLQSLSKYYIHQVDLCRKLIGELINFAHSQQLDDINLSEEEFREFLYQILDKS